MGVRQEERDSKTTKSQQIQKRMERLNDYYGDIPSGLTLGQ